MHQLYYREPWERSTPLCSLNSTISFKETYYRGMSHDLAPHHEVCFDRAIPYKELQAAVDY